MTDSVNSEEIGKFEKIAAEWWDAEGKFKPLHQMNPARLEFITAHLATRTGRQRSGGKYLAGLDILDVGCGGGLISEPLARLGANTTGIDAGEENIKIAMLHAKKSGLEINYRHSTVEGELLAGGTTYDAVVSMEVVEHVENPERFIKDCAKLLKPGGVMFLSTLNRTVKSLILAKIGAEYVLRWVPKGTHDWNKFIKPSEISKWLRDDGMSVGDIKGMSYNPLISEWHLSPDISMNYLVFAHLG